MRPAAGVVNALVCAPPAPPDHEPKSRPVRGRCGQPARLHSPLPSLQWSPEPHHHRHTRKSPPSCPGARGQAAPGHGQGAWRGGAMSPVDARTCFSGSQRETRPRALFWRTGVGGGACGLEGFAAAGLPGASPGQCQSGSPPAAWALPQPHPAHLHLKLFCSEPVLRGFVQHHVPFVMVFPLLVFVRFLIYSILTL